MSSSDDIISLKKKQDRLTTRETQLWNHFVKFREGLLESLADFTEQAVAGELRGVKECEQKRGERVIEVHLKLNETSVLVVSPGCVYPLDRLQGALAGMIFIYVDDKPTVRPVIQITVSERDIPSHLQLERFGVGVEGGNMQDINSLHYQYEGSYCLTGEPKVLARGEQVSKAEGSNLGRQVISWFYRITHEWKEWPTWSELGDLGGRKPIGFIKE